MIKLAFWILVLISLIIFLPFVWIWAFNTLFPALMIDYNIKTWLASVFILVAINYAKMNNNK